MQSPAPPCHAGLPPSVNIWSEWAHACQLSEDEAAVLEALQMDEGLLGGSVETSNVTESP